MSNEEKIFIALFLFFWFFWFYGFYVFAFCVFIKSGF